MNGVNARQVAFVKMAKLFTDFIRASDKILDQNPELQSRAAKVLADEFSEIMDQYDRTRITPLHEQKGGWEAFNERALRSNPNQIFETE